MALLENDETGFLSVFTMENIANAANATLQMLNPLDWHDTDFWYHYMNNPEPYWNEVRSLGTYPPNKPKIPEPLESLEVVEAKNAQVIGSGKID